MYCKTKPNLRKQKQPLCARPTLNGICVFVDAHALRLNDGVILAAKYVLKPS